MMKLDLNLDIEWYYYILSSDENDYTNFILVMSDNSVISAGCIRGIALKNNLDKDDCDITTIKYSKTGSLIWARATGGTGTDIITGIAASDNYEYIYHTGATYSPNYIVSSGGDFYLAC